MSEENLYVIATSPNLTKKLHHRFVPMGMFDEKGNEVLLPIVVGSARDHNEIESGAEAATKKLLKIDSAPEKDSQSSWKKIMDAERAIRIVYCCTRLPDDLSKRYFENINQVQDTYGPDELAMLMDHYATVKYTQPHYRLIDPESSNAFQETIDKIKKLGEESDFFLNGHTTHSVNLLIKYLVSQLPNYENITG